jgi:nitroreductase
MESFLKLAKDRYSVRKYSDREIEKEKMDIVLEACNVAPTGKNNQPQRIYVVKDPGVLAKLAELTPCTFGAGTVLAFAYDEEEEWKNPLEKGPHSGVQDVSIVASHAMLAAADIGLGTCWVNYFANSLAEKALGLPANERLVLLMPIGYPADDSEPSASHSATKPLESTVRFV